jgi:hypothetical protein
LNELHPSQAIEEENIMENTEVIPLTLKHWVKRKIADGDWTAEEIARHGCVTGFNGLIYYKETCALHDQYEDEVWEVAFQMAQETGEEPLYAFRTCGNLNSLKNELVWNAVEYYCGKILEKEEELQEDSGVVSCL